MDCTCLFAYCSFQLSTCLPALSSEVEGIYLFTSGIPDQTHDICSSYLEETCGGRNLRLHVVLFNVDDYDANGAIPSRYANITKTAESLRALAHCTEGRFHWFRETGKSWEISRYVMKMMGGIVHTFRILNDFRIF